MKKLASAALTALAIALLAIPGCASVSASDVSQAVGYVFLGLLLVFIVAKSR